MAVRRDSDDYQRQSVVDDKWLDVCSPRCAVRCAWYKCSSPHCKLEYRLGGTPKLHNEAYDRMVAAEQAEILEMAKRIKK